MGVDRYEALGVLPGLGPAWMPPRDLSMAGDHLLWASVSPLVDWGGGCGSLGAAQVSGCV